MSNKIYLTNEGFLEIEEELNHLKDVKRPEVIKALNGENKRKEGQTTLF